MNIYRTAPMKERQAQAEFRRVNIRAYVPTQEGKTTRNRRHRKAVAPGYVFSTAPPVLRKEISVVGSSEDGFTTEERLVECQHVREFVGTISRDALKPLYARRREAKPAPPRPYRVGDAVTVKLGTGPISGTVIKLLSNGARAIIETNAKTVTVSTKRLSLSGHT